MYNYNVNVFKYSEYCVHTNNYVFYIFTELYTVNTDFFNYRLFLNA